MGPTDGDSAEEFTAAPHLNSAPMSQWPGVFMVGFLVLGFAMAVMGSTRPDGGESIIKGKWAVAFENTLDEDIAVAEPSRAAWGIFEFGLFGNGRPGVLVGTDGWLYSDEEFKHFPGEAAEVAWKVSLIEAVRDDFKKRDIDLVVALIPSKSRICPEHLGRYHFPDYADARYSTVRSMLSDRGIAAPDLVGPLVAEKPSQAVFLRTDTHWTSRGAEVVAESLAASVDFEGKGDSAFKVEAGEPLSHKGDLVKFLPLGPLQASWGPANDDVVLRQVVADGGGGGLGLFDEVTIPVALVGTSYSEQTNWGFRESLKLHMGADVLDAAVEGRGPVVVMLDYLENKALEQTPPKLVVWEIPERFMPVVYDTKGHEATLERLGLGD